MPATDQNSPSAPQASTNQAANKDLNEIVAMAKEKGEQTRSAPKSVDNLAKFAWKNSTDIRQKIKQKLNIAYSIVTGLTNPEVRKELKKYLDKGPQK